MSCAFRPGALEIPSRIDPPVPKAHRKREAEKGWLKWRDRQKKPKLGISAFLKNWRQPTLAESIRPLPSARLCLTAEFGMGSGRTTALWPPRNVTGDTWQVTGKPPNATNPKMEKNKRREVTCHVSHVTSAVL